MAFTWEVEALRKLVEGIIADTASEYNKAADQLDVATQPPWAEDTGGKYGIDEPGFVSAEEERKVREALELDPDDPLPDHYEIDQWGNVWDLTIQDELERRALAEERAAWTSDPNDPRNYEWEDEGAFDYELDRYLSGKGDLASTRGKGAIKEWGMQDIHELEEKQWKEFKKDSKDKLKLDWVNEILKEFPEDKAPEVLRLPQWKDEEKPDMSPFLSYLLRQSPYARLPAAGLLGLGLMGYSKPAYQNARHEG